MVSKEMIQRTKSEFQRYSKEPITDAEAVEIYTNLVSFVNLLLEWSEEDNSEQ